MKVMIDENKLKELLRAQYTLSALEAGGVDNTIAYEESFATNLEYWNDEHSERQFKHWRDLAEYIADEATESVKGQECYVYLLWEDEFIIGAYDSREAAEAAQERIIDDCDPQSKVTYANEVYDFTTVITPFGEEIELEIMEVKVQ